MRKERNAPTVHEPEDLLEAKQAPRGLDELEVLMQVVKRRFTRNCVFCIAVTLLWPVLLPLGLLLSPCIWYAGYGSHQHVLAGTCIIVVSLIWFVFPMFVVSLTGELEYFVHLVQSGDIGWVELVQHVGSFLFFLLFLVYAWVVHEAVSLEVAASLDSRIRYLKNNWTMELVLTRPEQVTLMGKEGPVGVLQLLDKLERFPGWRTSFQGPELSERSHTRSELIMREDTPLLPEQAHERRRAPALSSEQAVVLSTRIKHMDAVVLSSEQFLAPSKNHFRTFQHKVLSLLRSLPASLGPVGFWGTILAAAVRALIPRVWVYFHLGGSFLPGHPVEATLVVLSTIVTFVSGAIWLLVLAAVGSQYAHNVSQMLLISAIVAPESRHEYMRSMMPSKPEMGMPMLDLSFSNNVKTWWAIREYAIVDSLDERTDLEVVLGVALIYQAIIITYCVADVVVKGHATATLCVALFDIIVVGAAGVRSMLHCVNVNEMLRGHAHVFMRARHSVFTSMKVDTVRQELPSPSPEERRKVLRLHSHLVDKVRHADTLQTLFNMEVTAANVGQLVVALACGVGSAGFSIVRAHQDAAA